jgi:hypothetical protein
LTFLKLICENIKESESGLLNGFIPGLLECFQNHNEDISPYSIVSILRSNKFLKLGQISVFFKKLIEKRNEQVKFLQKEIQFIRRKNNEDLKQYNILKTEEFTIEVDLIEETENKMRRV